MEKFMLMGLGGMSLGRVSLGVTYGFDIVHEVPIVLFDGENDFEARKVEEQKHLLVCKSPDIEPLPENGVIAPTPPDYSYCIPRDTSRGRTSKAKGRWRY